MNEEIKNLISAADRAIKEERFDDLMEFYTDDAVLVVRPGLEVQGKEAIKSAFIKIAAYFKNSVVPTQGQMLMIAAGAFLRSGLMSLWQEERSRMMSYRDRTAFRVSLVLLVAYIAAILLLTVIPHAVLLSVSGSLFPSPFSRSIIPFVAFGVILVSMAFGMISGRMQSLSDILEVLSYGIQRYAHLLVLYIFCIQLYQSLCFVFF